MPLSVPDFVKRWKINSLSERSGSQSHFIDLCDMLGQAHPAAADAAGERYAFDKPLNKVYGGKGFADVWLRDHFAWEYKGKHKDLKAAYKQINDYREDLGNPPLLVVCDLDRFEVHTNFTSTTKRIYAFNLSDLDRNVVTATCPLPPLEVLRALFGDTSVLRPDRTDAYVTQEAAKLFARLAERLEIEKRAHTESPEASKEQIAHFLMRILFCLFADSVDLLPNRVFRRLVEIDRFYPRRFLLKLPNLFAAMSSADGIFGEHTIRYFNGGLFDPKDISTILLDKQDMAILYDVAHNYNWAHVAPAIFGTLFERSLDEARRSLIGAHYTSQSDIDLLVEPVVMRPLRQRWHDVRDSVLVVLESSSTKSARASLLGSNKEAEELLAAWFDELASIRILDPACGSGNFLYVALRRLLDLWKEARDFAIERNILLAMKYAVENLVSPAQLYGIETEFYAHELASIVVWIGYLQWKYEHGITEDAEPILQKLANIEHDDAILRYDTEGKPYEPQWPPADYIIGNPPFLGGKFLRRELGDKYVDDLFGLYKNRVKAESDLVIYWFEKARAQIEAGNAKRVGLLSTQAIRNGANRSVLSRISETTKIFWAWSDREWLLDGAAVRVSMVGFGNGRESELTLNGTTVTSINPDLSSEEDVTVATALPENEGICYQGTIKVGDFDLSPEDARKMLAAPINPNGKANHEVVLPWINALDITGRPREMFIIDFGAYMAEAEAALYEWPFEHLKKHVKPVRELVKRKNHREKWWLHAEARPGLRNAISKLTRYIATPRVAKHRFFVWVDSKTVPDSRLFVFARDDNYFFGILQSHVHEAWSLATSSRHGDGDEGGRPTYNGASTFDTFPFPYPPGTEPTEADSPIVRAIADAARELIRLRDAWLNPPDASEADLKDRTLTKLYNARPGWLANAHRTLDAAVFAAYGWPSNLTNQEILSRLLALNHLRHFAHPHDLE